MSDELAARRETQRVAAQREGARHLMRTLLGDQDVDMSDDKADLLRDELARIAGRVGEC